MPWLWICGVSLIMLVAFVLSTAAPSPQKGIPHEAVETYLGNFRLVEEVYPVIQDFILRISQKYEFRTWQFTMPRMGMFSPHGGAMVICTPEAVKHVLKDEFNRYEKSEPVNSVLKDFLGNGIFSSDGTTWERHRKVAVNMFSRKLLRNSSEVALAQAMKLKERLSQAANTGDAVDIQRCFYAYTMDTFACIAFGVELDSQTKANSFVDAFDSIQQLSQNRLRNPLWKLSKLLQLTGEERCIRHNYHTLNNFASSVIAQKRRVMASQDDGTDLGPDLLSRFLSVDSTISNTELRDIVMNFIIAGRDTTAATLSWLTFELLKNPECLNKAVEEIELKQQQIGKPFVELPTERLFEIIEHELPYTTACANETLRLHPSVPKNIKYAVQPDTLPDGTKVEAGMAIIWSPYAMGRNPNLWPDPLVFSPERWLAARSVDTPDFQDATNTSIYKPTRKSDFVFPTFNAGPRLCLGRPLAYMEIVMALLVILPSFKLTEAKQHTDEYSQTIVPNLVSGLMVYIEQR